jgi:hypothetical protein
VTFWKEKFGTQVYNLIFNVFKIKKFDIEKSVFAILKSENLAYKKNRLIQGGAKN